MSAPSLQPLMPMAHLPWYRGAGSHQQDAKAHQARKKDPAPAAAAIELIEATGGRSSGLNTLGEHIDTYA